MEAGAGCGGSHGGSVPWGVQGLPLHDGTAGVGTGQDQRLHPEAAAVPSLQVLHQALLSNRFVEGSWIRGGMRLSRVIRGRFEKGLCTPREMRGVWRPRLCVP